MEKEKKIIDLVFVCIDFWSKPIYKVKDKEAYFCSTDILFPDKDIAPNNTPEEINTYFREHQDQIVLLGANIDDDPDGRKASNWEYNFITT